MTENNNENALENIYQQVMEEVVHIDFKHNSRASETDVNVVTS